MQWTMDSLVAKKWPTLLTVFFKFDGKKREKNNKKTEKGFFSPCMLLDCWTRSMVIKSTGAKYKKKYTQNESTLTFYWKK